MVTNNERTKMAQMTENLVLEAYAHCEAGNMPPLTVWEVRQLIHGWMLAQKTRNDAERYRYLRNRVPAEVLGQVKSAAGCWIDCEDEEGTLILLTGDDADAAVDAAMLAAQAAICGVALVTGYLVERFADAPMWLVCGENGAGKSALFDAVEYALYGQHRGGAYRGRKQESPCAGPQRMRAHR